MTGSARTNGNAEQASSAHLTNTSLFEGQGECVGLVRSGVRWAAGFGCWRARFPVTVIAGWRAAARREGPAGAGLPARGGHRLSGRLEGQVALVTGSSRGIG